eukprot:351375-Chlamydomonas_euryale.AAC.9
MPFSFLPPPLLPFKHDVLLPARCRHTVELLGDLAQQGQEQLRKGMLVHVRGDVRVEAWTARNGDMRVQVLVEADEVMTLTRLDYPAACPMQPEPLKLHCHVPGCAGKTPSL